MLVSCPEVARILLNKKEPCDFLYIKEGDGYTKIRIPSSRIRTCGYDRRDALFCRTERKTRRFVQALVLGIAHDLERRVRRG